ncbi:cell wall-active antibiotics response protein LiaF [Streptococcus pluranimalium]|uniref:cell wall-active antibiotics response protein LiaF n=1 Tax=Streptococcus pluranimalium TaxID=82348 RepID=UPI0039FDBE9B
MRKFQFFIIVEAVLLLLAMMTILADDVPRFIAILIMTLLALKFYNSTDKANFLLTACLLVFFLIIMLNPYVILAMIVGFVYMMLNHFSQVRKNNRLATLSFETRPVTMTKYRNQWFGADDVVSDVYYFDDIDVIRLSGNDTIDLSKVILRHQDNVILIRKVYGPTKIVVPIDVSVSLTVSSIYGGVSFFDDLPYDLRNETIKLRSDDYDNSSRRVKIVVSNLAGDTEVVSR